MDWGDWFMWVGFTLLLALGLAYMLTGWYDDFSSQCRTETIENLIIILGIVVPIYNAVQSGSNAKKISASTNLCLATVTFILVGFESYKSTRARRKLIEGAYGSLSMYQSEFSSIKEDGILLIGKRKLGWRTIPGKVIARLIFCLFSFLFSASEVCFRFDAADHPHNWFNKQLSKCFAKYSFSLSPIFLGALFLFNRFADFQEKPNRPKALVSTCRSVTFDANTTDGRTLAINFMVRTPGDRDYDWSIDFADVIVLSFDVSDKKAKTTLEAKVTKLKEVLPKKPIVLIGRFKKTDAPEGPSMQHDRDVLDSIAQISVDFAMVLNFESGANARTLVDVIAVLCDTS